jgi:exodeoxyribonuclease V alpha subunit
LYLERYWRFEEQVADHLLSRCASEGGLAIDSGELEAILEELFGAEETDLRQREAAERALTRRLTVVAGGPGTGKTLTIARLLGAAYSVGLARGRQLEIALCAPTGKAATRMEAALHQGAATLSLRPGVEGALRATEAKTLHRLLGIGTTGIPRYDSTNRLPHDLVVVDETSMVSLPLMARLLDALRPESTVVLVGDPFQLASVEAGAVLGEIVGPKAFGEAYGPLAADVVMLEHNHRFGPDSQIAALADAIRTGDDEGAMGILRDGDPDELIFVEIGEATGAAERDRLAALKVEAASQAVAVVRAAQEGDSETGLARARELKVLCATRYGLLGVTGWTAAIETLARQELPYAGIGGRRYVGRPIIVTRNDYFNNVFNGDVGLVVAGTSGQVAVFGDPNGTSRELALSQLGETDTWWATTIHKSQGSEFEKVIVSLPPAPSPILTRELLYTAVTRAKSQVTLVASEESVRSAIRRPIARASGLRPKLWPEATGLARPRRGTGRSPQAQQLSFDL